MTRHSIGELPPTSPATTAGVSPLSPSAPLNYAGQPLPPAPAANATPTPSGLFNAFKRRWVLGTFLGALIAVAAALGVWVMLPGGKHEARGHIELREKNESVVNRNSEDYESYRRQQIFVLKTRTLLNRTTNDPAVASLESLRGAEDPVHVLEDSIFIAQVAPSTLSVTMKGNNLEDMKVIVDALMKRYVDDATATDRSVRDEKIKSRERLREDLTRDIEAMETRIKMYARTSGNTGSEMTNSGQEFTREILKYESLISEEKTRITKLESELQVQEERLGSFKISDKSLDDLQISGVPDKLVGKLRVLRDREFRNRQQFLHEVERQLSKEELSQWRNHILGCANMPNTQQPIVPEGEIIARINSDPRVKKLEEDLAEIEGRLTRATENAPQPETHPVVLGLKEDREKKKQEIDRKKQEIKGTVTASVRSSAVAHLQNTVMMLEKDIAVAKETRDRYMQEKEMAFKSRSGSAENQIEISQLLKQVQPQREALAKVQTDLVQLQSEAKLDNRTRIVEPAQALPNNNLNKKMLMAGAAGVGSFFLSIFLVAFLEWRTRRVDGVDQVVNELGMRIIGTVPAFPNKASIKAAAEAGGANWRFSLNESVNSARTMLLHTARSQSMQVVMVTSPTQGEGKTSITSQLASSMATAGMRTLIVDCDLRNPSIHKLFDLGLSPGVSEILTQDADPADAVQPTAVPNLWVIPAGQCSNRVIAALAQGHPLETLFNRLRGQFDFVIVDSCPVLPVADALLIGQHVDGVLFSIMQDITQIPKVVLASEKLGQLNIPVLGAVVNGIKQDVYSYGYNYVKQLPA